MSEEGERIMRETRAALGVSEPVSQPKTGFTADTIFWPSSRKSMPKAPAHKIGPAKSQRGGRGRKKSIPW